MSEARAYRAERGRTHGADARWLASSEMRRRRVRDPPAERVEVERGEGRHLPPHAAHLEARGRADRDEPGERAREAIEVGLHHGALLVPEQLDVALPDEITRGLPGRRGRRRGRQDAPSLVDRLEAGQDSCVVPFRLQQGAQASDPVAGGDVREVNPEDVVEDGVVRRPDRVHVPRQQQFPATQAVRDVHEAAAVGVQPEGEQDEPDVVRRDRGHRGPLEAGRLALVEPGIAGRDLHVAVEGAAWVAQETVGQGPPARDRVRLRCGVHHQRPPAPSRPGPL